MSSRSAIGRAHRRSALLAAPARPRRSAPAPAPPGVDGCRTDRGRECQGSEYRPTRLRDVDQACAGSSSADPGAGDVQGGRADGPSTKGRRLGSGSDSRRRPLTPALKAEGTTGGDTEFLLLCVPAGHHRDPKQFQEVGFRLTKNSGGSGSRHGDLLRTHGRRGKGTRPSHRPSLFVPSSERTKQRTTLATPRGRTRPRADPAHAGGEQKPGAGDEGGARATRHQGRVRRSPALSAPARLLCGNAGGWPPGVRACGGAVRPGRGAGA